MRRTPFWKLFCVSLISKVRFCTFMQVKPQFLRNFIHIHNFNLVENSIQHLQAEHLKDISDIDIGFASIKKTIPTCVLEMKMKDLCKYSTFSDISKVSSKKELNENIRMELRSEGFINITSILRTIFLNICLSSKDIIPSDRAISTSLPSSVKKEAIQHQTGTIRNKML